MSTMQNQVQDMEQRRWNKLKGLVYSTSSRRPFVTSVMKIAEWHLAQSLRYEALAQDVQRLDRENPIKSRKVA